MHQLASDQGAPTLSKHFPCIDVLDAEWNLSESEVYEIDDGDEDEQDGNSGQRYGNCFVGTGDIGPHIPFKVGLVDLGNPESAAVFGPAFFIGRYVFPESRKYRILRLLGHGRVLQLQIGIIGPFTEILKIMLSQG